jgi:hypothetical protein
VAGVGRVFSWPILVTGKRRTSERRSPTRVRTHQPSENFKTEASKASARLMTCLKSIRLWLRVKERLNRWRV